MRQGASAANAFASPRRSQGASPQDLPKMTERMFQYGSDFAAMWFDAMGLIMSNLNGGPPSQAPVAPPSSVAASAPRPSSRLALDLRSQRPAEVRLTLDQPVARERLAIESLRARKGSAKIDGATITITERRVGGHQGHCASAQRGAARALYRRHLGQDDQQSARSPHHRGRQVMA